MPRAPRPRGSKRHHEHREPYGEEPDGQEPYEREPYDDPEEHLEIERQRFRGGLPPTPELYARAREQWYRLPGSRVRPPMDPVIGESGAGEQHPPGQEQPDKKRGEP